MLQVKFVKKPQKHILSFSKVLCAPSGEWLLPLHTCIQSCDEKQFKFSNNFALELPPNFLRFKSTTFSLVCENPLPGEYWCIFNEFEASKDGTKPPISLATRSVTILLEYAPEGLESCMYGRSWRSLTSSLGQADRGGQIKRKAKKILCSPQLPKEWCFQPKPCIRTDSPEKPRHLKFWSSKFYLSSLPQLVALFYKWPQRRTNSV